MYDTIKAYYPFEDNPIPSIDRVMRDASNVCEHFNNETQTTYITGKIGSLKIGYNQNSLSINGSLVKFYKGNNFHTLTREEAGYSIAQLSELLGAKMGMSVVSRVDYSTNLLTKYKPEYYYNYLDVLARYHRAEYGSSLYYHQSTNNLVFYDKHKWAKKHHILPPTEFQGKNVLRYELAIKKGVNKALNKQLLLMNLDEKDTYNNLLDLWHKKYQDISKKTSQIIHINKEAISTPKDFDRQLLAMMTKTIGFGTIDSTIEELKEEKVFSKPEYYSRLKRKYKKYSEVEINQNDVISEIDSLIKEVVIREKSM